ncbi:MAG: hypothetical protein QG597_5174, partial [Actinomycetota bacterium]|nr:hypothetical protein [Actinomycetota bacterium]
MKLRLPVTADLR